ncbi:MAG: D-alanyl-D-alanine carboxypeptidase, partial [Armatimonadetes bacterium]|nr:D-alanyl-D-alanine carboxypeptidase [Armatimonadota bacterium]
GLHGVRAFLERQGIDRAGAILYDGSGLSRYGLVTPRAIVGVLRAMAFHPARQAWFEALPVAGEDGTIARRMRGTLAAANVRAKTGYYAHHTSLSGYVTTRAGDVLLVATLFNHSPVPAPDMRLLHDRFFVALAKATR